MRPSNKSRSRNKSGNNPNRRNVGNVVNRVFESAGPDGKVRGTPQQIIDKYQALARDAQVSGDRVAAENHLQHAEHYTRLLGEAQRQMQENRPERDDRDDREDAEPHRERERTEAGERPQPPHRPEPHRPEPERRQEPQRRPEPQRMAEPSGLITLGAEDGGEDGPVETPEEAARHRQEAAGPRGSVSATNGEDRAAAEPQTDPQADAPAKRPRTRRKAKAVIQPAEANAE
jgi:Domain of unknown function (DUF4167)